MFSSVFTHESIDDIPSIQIHQIDIVNNYMPSNQKKQKVKLFELNPSKSPGPGNLHPRLLKEMNVVLENPLLHCIINAKN